MERAFIVNEGSAFFENEKEYRNSARIQNEFIKKFFAENGIDAAQYRVGGNGSVNVPFTKADGIRLKIVPTANDKEKFGGVLSVPGDYGLSLFKKTSKIAKVFAEQCVAECIVVNLHSPRLGDEFKSVRWGRHSQRKFMRNGKLYVSIESENLGADEIPDGFAEIKMSELYRVIEEIEGAE